MIVDIGRLASLYLMLGSVAGFLFFYDNFNYYCSPFSFDMPMWALVPAFVLIGLLAGYIYPDIVHVMASAVFIPLAGAAFCFAIFASPALARDIVGEFSDWLFELAKFILFDLVLACLAIFSAGFVSLYLFETE